MKRVALAALALVVPAAAQHEHCDHDHDPVTPAHAPVSPHHPDLKLPSHDDAWFHFHPFLSAAVAFGGSTSEKNYGLIQGGHAPIDDGFNLQGIEVGALMELGPYLSMMGVYNTFWDKYDGWDGELEELYATVSLPAGVSVRAGQFFVPFGHENQTHLHDREFVEPPISVIRLLGEEGLITQGGDIGFIIPGIGEKTVFRFGYGQTRPHSHGMTREQRREFYEEALEHAGEDHDDHDEDHDDHDDHGDEDHDDHDHDDHDHGGHSHGFAGNGGIFDMEDAYLDDGYFFARLESDVAGDYGFNLIGASIAAGQNGFERTTWVVGADAFGTFTVADRPAWWRTEAFYRYVDAIDNNGNPGSFDECGIYAATGIRFHPSWTCAARLEWASGDRAAGAERRWRASTAVTHLSNLAPNADLHTRLQYSYDDLGGYGNEHSVWLQFVLNIGTGCDGHVH
ncbi:hypothetical protein [Haloferula sp. A504]|uniref:hypothetical protein n=1 Tax=Haloferula sp. A504 TaxID=3373601 RepID=UPI0031BD02A9|nr:hypothetical protein [Verrucomicrobiaceae bacterium E54]